MRKQIRRELIVLAEHSSLISLCAVLAAFGGILMWVHGSMAVWVFRALKMPSFVPGFTVFFLLWLLLYGLYGAVTAMLIMNHTVPWKTTGSALKAVAGSIMVYVVLLAWYPLFFSVIHSLLAIPVLLAAAVLRNLICIKHSRCFLLLIPVSIFAGLLEIYFLCVTISFVLAN